MIPDAIEVRLNRKERAELEARLRAATTEQRQLLRIKIVLEAADGFGTREIARELDTTPTTVSLCGVAMHAKDWRGSKICRAPAPLPATVQQPTSVFARSSTSRHPRDLHAGTGH